jgi:hypothetical protein
MADNSKTPNIYSFLAHSSQNACIGMTHTSLLYCISSLQLLWMYYDLNPSVPSIGKYLAYIVIEPVIPKFRYNLGFLVGVSLLTLIVVFMSVSMLINALVKKVSTTIYKIAGHTLIYTSTVMLLPIFGIVLK